ncbi:MAG: type II/IV secretion system protein [Flavobacteriia bacterium]|nr:type II/IV secretion system protein [Flavobacteriia bacterium]
MSNLCNVISREQAYHYRVVPVSVNDDVIEIITDKADNESLEFELQLFIKSNFRLSYVSKAAVDSALKKLFPDTINEAKKLSLDKDILEEITKEAVDLSISDLHIEPVDEGGVIRMRIDGILVRRFYIMKIDYPLVVNTIKVKAGLDISEKRLPQDGRMIYKFRNEDIDFRISTLPVYGGEKVVLRILRKEGVKAHLYKLGFTNAQFAQYQNAITRRQGLILISGPTGSGKTTTLYKTLEAINSADINVLTVEDPIEYKYNGIAQVQVNEKIGLTFPRALKTLLRQDPDVIMIGEIRDTETAQIAIRASLTGHLVLSTIHTNSAIETVVRLEDMGIPRYLISGALTISLAQRLVRKVCEICSIEVESDTISNKPELNWPHIVKKAQECEACHNTGYKGRLAIYEVVPMNSEVWSLIDRSALDLEKVYTELGIPMLKEQVFKLVENHSTTIEEAVPYLI